MFIIRFFFALLFFFGVCGLGYLGIQHYPSHAGIMTITTIVGAVFYWLSYIPIYKRDRHRGAERPWVSASKAFIFTMILMLVVGASVMAMME